MPLIVGGTVFEQSTAVVVARVVDANKAPLIQSDVSTIQFEVWDVSESPPAQVVAAQTLVVASVVFDTLVVDSVWTALTGETGSVAGQGYNFRTILPDTTFPKLDLEDFPDAKAYSISFRWVLTSGDKFSDDFEVVGRHHLFGK